MWLLNGQEKYLLPQPAGQRGRPRPHHLQGGLDRPGHRRLERLRTPPPPRSSSTPPTARSPSKDGSADRRRRPLAAAGEDRAHRRPEGQVPAAEGLYGLVRRPARPRPGARGPARAARRHPAGRRTAPCWRRPACRSQGVLDDLYARRDQGRRSARSSATAAPRLSVWAPTAQQRGPGARRRTRRRCGATPPPASGRCTGPRSWTDKPYRYVVTVWAPSVRKVVVNKVTDPYSVALTADSARACSSTSTTRPSPPSGWSSQHKPKAVPLSGRRDPGTARPGLLRRRHRPSRPPDRGTYLAFTDTSSDGSKHLRELAKAGHLYVHLLPAFDFATIAREEGRPGDARLRPRLLRRPTPSSSRRASPPIAAKDAYNWGYDPYHYTVPEGSYATDPDGTGRTVEFRQMVQALNERRPAGRHGRRLQPHRRERPGATPASWTRSCPATTSGSSPTARVATSTCCANTATENAMMGKLVVDSVVTWAKEYKVDGFRFDLMGHHPKANILAVRKALDALTPAKDGVDGKKIILYGEGWNFGEVADDARFVQATQKNMAGTGIATFSDRARDAVRGGSPFDEDPGVQGFASGLYTDPNSSTANGTPAEQKARLLHYQDLIKVGLTGNLAAVPLHRLRRQGGHRRRDRLQRRARPATRDAPGDALAYVDAHDNESLYDALTYKLPAGTSRRRPGPDAGPRRWPPPPSPRARPSPRPAPTCCAPSPSTATPSTAATGSTRSTGTAPRRQRLRPRAAAGRRQRVQVALRQAPAGRRSRSAAPQIDGGLRRLPGPAADPHDGARLLARHGRRRCSRQLSFPLSGQGRDARGDHHDARRPGRRVQRDARRAGADGRPRSPGPATALHPVQAAGADPTVQSASYTKETGTFAVPARTVAVFSRTPLDSGITVVEQASKPGLLHQRVRG